MNGRSKCLLGLYFRPARNDFHFGNKKKSHWVWSGEHGGEANSYFFFLQKPLYPLCRYEWGHCHVEDGYLKKAGRPF